MTGLLHLAVMSMALAIAGPGAWVPGPTEASAEEAPAGHGEHDDHEGEGEHPDHDEDGDVHVAEEAGHADHGDEVPEDAGGHAEHEDEQVVRLDQATIAEFGVAVKTAGPGQLQVSVSLPGEIVIDPDRLAHIVPRVPGIARHVSRRLGESVRAGEVLAVLESRELSELKSAYLIARERLHLAEATHEREEKLWKQQVSSEREFLESRQALAETRIEMRAAEQKLHALGFSEGHLHGLSFDEDDAFTRYEIAAPFDGTVIEKHITLGELLQGETEAFVVADLSSVWANLTVYQNDLPIVRTGQSVTISTGPGGPAMSGQISYVSPIIDAATRTATARVVVPNRDAEWRPGTFVTGQVSVERVRVATIIPRTALQTIGGKSVVFVETDEGFEPHSVTLGRANHTWVEVVAGLAPGQRYVADGAFVLKAQLAKGAFGDGHNH